MLSQDLVFVLFGGHRGRISREEEGMCLFLLRFVEMVVCWPYGTQTNQLGYDVLLGN